MPNRKIIQILAPDDALIALCDDGSIWNIADGGRRWVQEYPAIPQDDEPETVMAPVDRQSWPPAGLSAMDLWYRDHGGAPHKIEDGNTFLEAIEKNEQVVAAVFSSEAKQLLDMPSDALETLNFDYAGASFTVPANPIPF